MKKIRNFSIIAHIDHGKSTISDRIIQKCGGLSEREMSNQVLDSMEIEKERGITIKAQTAAINYLSKNNKTYKFNLIDTPGHVNFSYEVFRSLYACEGALLVIDASQGIEAQTLANFYSAKKMNLKIIPVINKIDLPHSNPQIILKDLEQILQISSKDSILCSAKTGKGIINLLEKIVSFIPSPTGNSKNPLQAIIIDSWFDNYLGVIALIRIKNGCLKKNSKIQILSTKKIYKIIKMGIFTPKTINLTKLKCGSVGWIVIGEKKISSAPVGDIITEEINKSKIPIKRFKKITPQIYSSLYPIDTNQYSNFKIALEKLSLNDTSLFYQPENSKALGFGFKCGFLGILHLEIIKERLEREYNIDVISTSPAVMYKIKKNKKKSKLINSVEKFPVNQKNIVIKEPIAICTILLTEKYIGNIMNLCKEKRGIQKNMIYHNPRKIILIYEIPMSEVVLDFFDQIKSVSSGYASLEYKFKKFKKSKLVCLHIFINSKKIDALSLIIHSSQVLTKSKEIVENMKNIIPKHQFEINIRAIVNNKIIARSTIKQLRKNVLSKCYGGDISRKKKLLYKQKIGKKKMKKIGKINIPKESFFSFLYKNKKK